MKKLIYLFTIAGLISLGSCNNAKRSNEGNKDAENDLMDQRDTSGLKEEFNSRGVPAEGINDHNAIREDSIEVDKGNSKIMDGLPAEIREKIKSDENLRNKRLTNSRKYSDGGSTFYE